MFNRYFVSRPSYIDQKRFRASASFLNSLPKRLIKFCEPEHLSFYSGTPSIKLGTLEEYSAIENKATMGSRFDPDEGRITKLFNFAGPLETGYMNMDNGIIVEGNYSSVHISGCTVSNKVNEFLFCASGGPYNRILHEQILTASKFDYPGNPKLTSYVIFNTKKLIKSIEAVARKHSENRANPDEIIVVVGAVTYEKVARQHQPTFNRGSRTNQEKLSNFVDAVFQKPAFFAPENEIRIVVRLNSPGHIPLSTQSIYLHSELFKDAIVTTGSL